MFYADKTMNAIKADPGGATTLSMCCSAMTMALRMAEDVTILRIMAYQLGAYAEMLDHSKIENVEGKMIMAIKDGRKSFKDMLELEDGADDATKD